MSNFTPLSSVPTFITSREITTGPRARSINGFRSIVVSCGSCQHRWPARPGEPAEGGFSMAIGAVRIGCPACGVEGSMPVQEVIRVASG